MLLPFNWMMGLVRFDGRFTEIGGELSQHITGRKEQEDHEVEKWSFE